MQTLPDPNDSPVLRALGTMRTAAYVLRDLDLNALDELDQGAISDWQAALADARTTFLTTLRARGCEELEVPPRGQLERFDEVRVKNHVRGISRAVLAEFDRVDAAQAADGQVSTSIVFGLLYSLRSIEQFIRWQDPEERRRRSSPAAWEPETPGQVAGPEDEEPEPAAASPWAEYLGGPSSEDLGAPSSEDLAAPSREDPGASSSEDLAAPSGNDPEGLSPEPGAAAGAALGVSFEWAADVAPLPAPPPAPVDPAPDARPVPKPRVRRDLDISSYYKHPDEYGAAVRMYPASVFHAGSCGPEFAKREQCLGWTSVLPIPGGVAFALADGRESSIGARVASVLSTTRFCELLAAAPEAPTDARSAILGAAGEARRELEKLLDALIQSADDSHAMTRLCGAMPVNTVRRILEHTMNPDPGLRNVTPALAISVVGGVLLRNARDTYDLTLLSLGGAAIERKQRAQFPEVLLPAEQDATVRFAPGGAIPWEPAAVPVHGPVELIPGDIVLVGSSALRRGYSGSALAKLSLLCPDILQLSSIREDHAMRVLLQAAAAADRYEALEERRLQARTEQGRKASGASIRLGVRQRLFAGDLSMVLLTLERMRTPSITGETAPTALSAISRLLRKP